MFKQIIFISMVLVALASANCNINVCVEENGPCNADNYGFGMPMKAKVGDSGIPDRTIATCNQGLRCANNVNYVNGGSGYNPEHVCYPIGLIGDYCESNSQCMSGLTCYQNNPPILALAGESGSPGTCQNLYYAGFGESCSSDLHCVDGGDSMQCSLDGVCVARLTADSIDYFYYDCHSDVQCPSNQYCNTSTASYSNCLPRATLGQPCSGDDEIVCESNLLCDISEDGIAYTCITPFTETENAKCSGYNEIGSVPVKSACDIASSLYCNGGVCTKLPTATPTSTNCSSDGCSGYDETCSCGADQYTGQCFEVEVPTNLAACKSSSLAFYNCVQKAGCSTDFEYYNTKDSCAMEECQSEYCEVISSCQTAKPSTCFSADFTVKDVGICGKITSSSSSVSPVIIASFILAIVAALL
eukprot:gene15034-17785_t